MRLYNNKQSGFTLIEIIVSLALFSVVITIAVGALLILIASNRQLQSEQSVLTNLSFALDSMTREIRTGTNYYCDTKNVPNVGTSDRRIFESGRILADGTSPDQMIARDCEDGRTGSDRLHGLSFVEGGDSITVDATGSRIVYYHDADDGKLYRRLSGQPPESIVSDGLFITDADFYVTGSDRTDDVQPKVTVVLRAYASQDDFSADTAGDRAYVIQTTVTQRTLDI